MEKMNINIPADQLKDRICECTNTVFIVALNLKEVPTLYSPTGKPETMMLQVGFLCSNCGKMMPLRPEPPKEEEKKLIILGGNKSN